MKTKNTVKDVTFYDNVVPNLKAGEYTFKIGQALKVDTDPTLDKPQDPVTKKFILRGPRFVVAPGDVHRAFPPPGKVGLFDIYLPMVVFNKRALPWEREMKFQPGQNVNEEQAAKYPWMALMLFTEDELDVPQPASGASAPPPSGSQKNPTRTASFTLNDVIKPPDGILGPALALEDDEDPAKIRCNVIDVPADTFTALIPSVDDLCYLAHARQVTMDHKALINMKHDGWFSVIVGNRFAVPPDAGAKETAKRNIVHLVSLEGFEQYLGADGYTPPTLTDKKVRLISLYSWSFNCHKDLKENFSQMMLDLIAPESEQGTDLLMRMPLSPSASFAASDAEKAAVARVRDGYIPLHYTLRTGEQTFAWYRGPLSPIVNHRYWAATDVDDPETVDDQGYADAPDAEVPRTASEAMIFDTTTGVFDQSYAVAWQTGRSLALADKTFATSVLHWRRQAHALIDLLLEMMRSAPYQSALHTAGILDADSNLTPDTDVDDLAQLLDADILSNAFKDYLSTEFADTIAQQVGKRGGYTPDDTDQQPGHPTTPQPSVPAALSDLMQQPQVVALLQQLSGLDGTSFQIGIMPEEIIEWLAQRTLLYDVPFDNLVPSARMLPVGSIRFFYVDWNWIDALIDGALSVGIQSSRDSLFHTLMRDPLRRAVYDTLYQVRDKLRGKEISSKPTLGVMTGFILRSPVVSAYPGLEVKAYLDTADPPIKPLRLDTISPNTLIAIYPDIPVSVELDEPSEGLVFGREDQSAPDDGVIAPRYVPGVTGVTGDNLGQMINPKDATKWVTLSQINAAKRAAPPGGAPAALKIAGTGDNLIDALKSKLPGLSALSPASFAVQMVRVPEQMLFIPPKGGN